ncbi:hypothetical protein [Pseudoxanthomonas mexicana]
MPLTMATSALHEFLLPVLTAPAAGADFDQQWRAGAGWNAT